jgi:hypothetical protein
MRHKETGLRRLVASPAFYASSSNRARFSDWEAYGRSRAPERVPAAFTRQFEWATAVVWFGLSSRRKKKERIVQISGIPFVVTDWSQIERIEHKGQAGVAYWQAREFGAIRVRMVEYSAGYLADHWCTKGHILLCLAGELDTELKDGRSFTLTPGMSYQVADHAEAHRSSTATGARLFIVD